MDIFYVFLLRLISFLDEEKKIIGTLLLFLVLIINILYLRKWKISIKKEDLTPILILVYFIVHTLIFSGVSIQFFGIIFSYYLWYLFFKNKFKNKSRFAAIQFLVFSLTVYNLTNFIWYKIDYSHLRTGINTTLGLFNIVAYRVNFPMASGLTINSIQIGITSLLTLYIFKNSTRFLTKSFFFILYFWNIYLLVVLDSRSPLLISLMLGIVIGLGLKTIIKVITKYWAAIAIFAIIVVNIFYNTDIFQNIKRPGELDEEFFKRPKIWGMALEYTFHDFRFLFGYGLNTFNELISQQLVFLSTTHNIFLQVLFDFGVFGIIIMGYFLQKTMKILMRIKDTNFTLIFISFFLYGCLESMPSYYTFTPTLIFIPIIIIIYNYKE
jgi:O-antigen ligase